MATYLSLVNTALGRLNEVRLTSSNFASATAFHLQAKEAVTKAISRIQRESLEWPFNHVSYEEPLVVGQTFYPLQNDAEYVDYDSFFIKESTVAPIVQKKWLRPIEYDHWRQRFAALDADSGTDGRGVPDFVFGAQDLSYGISKSPDEIYTIQYEYFRVPPKLVLWDDEPTIPDRFEDVIDAGTMMYCYMFRENLEAAQLEKSEFRSGIERMRTALINKNIEARDTRVSDSIIRGF